MSMSASGEGKQLVEEAACGALGLKKLASGALGVKKLASGALGMKKQLSSVRGDVDLQEFHSH